MLKKAIVLLSGGLDSLVALDIVLNEYEVVNSLTFDYGQKSAQEEILAAKKIAKKYNLLMTGGSDSHAQIERIL